MSDREDAWSSTSSAYAVVRAWFTVDVTSLRAQHCSKALLDELKARFFVLAAQWNRTNPL
jgi:hypothetical protein